jgi:phosphoribosyl 1,2-cyclic phosphodiesterase
LDPATVNTASRTKDLSAVGSAKRPVPRAVPSLTPESNGGAGVIRLHFWGVRGSIPSPGFDTARYGGNTACLTLELPGPPGQTDPSGSPAPTLFILDAGTGLRTLGLKLMAEKRLPLTAHLFLSHTHWDHIQGFPFFAPAFMPGNQIVVYGGTGTDGELANVLTGQMLHRYFPVSLSELGAQIKFQHTEVDDYEIAGVRVHVGTVHHPGMAVGYRFETPGGVIAYCTDTEPIGADAAHPGSADPANMPLDPNVMALAQNADLLIHDAQFTDEEYPAGRVGWGHSPITFAVRTALAAGVKRLILFHHDPSRTDDAMDALLVRARAIGETLSASIPGRPALQIDAAMEGMEILQPVRPATPPESRQADAASPAPAPVDSVAVAGAAPAAVSAS